MQRAQREPENLDDWYESILQAIKQDLAKNVEPTKPKLMHYVGPAFLIAMACLDPGNLSGDIAVGQMTEFRLLWLLIISGILCYHYQSLALTVGVYSQRDLAQLCRLYYPFKWNVSIWAMTEIALLASDTQEVLGTAISLKILFNIEIFYGVFFSLLLVFLMLFLQNKGQSFFEKIFAMFIWIMGICFFCNFFVIEKDWAGIVRGFVPRIEIKDFSYGISLLGAILMPPNLFLHSSLVNTRKINRQNRYRLLFSSNRSFEIQTVHKYFNLETGIIIVVSMTINFFIIITFSHFSQEGGLIQLKDAGMVLEQSFGKWAKYLWAIGLFSSGQSATMAGTITGQYMMDGFLNLKISRKKRILIARLITLVPCLFIAKFAEIEMVYILLNMVQFIQLPFVLIPLFKFIENEKIMNGYRINKYKLIALQIVSLLFVIVNFIQMLYNIPSTFTWIFWFSLGSGVYIVLLLKLKNIPIVYKEIKMTEMEYISSLEC